jgi:hypothetical protein
MAVDATFDELKCDWLQRVRADSPTMGQLGNHFAQKIITQLLGVKSGTGDIVYCERFWSFFYPQVSHSQCARPTCAVQSPIHSVQSLLTQK